MKTIIVSLIIVLTIFTFVTPSHALWWMVYHKPAFKGKVIDAETKEPIAGAVVVVIYEKYPIISGPGGGSASIMNIKEFLTDKNGEFYAPSYTTIIQPFSIEAYASFIIFKPGYGSFPWYRVSPPMELSLDATMEFFPRETGTEGEIGWDYKKDKKIKVAFGIVELPKLKTREERLNSLRSANLHGEVHWNKIKKLMRLINEEYKSLGITPYKEEE